MRKIRNLAAMCIPIVALAGIAAPAAAVTVTPSWNGYHWARTGPLMIGIGDNVSSTWDSYLTTAATKWTAANNIGYVVTTGKSTPSTCGGVFGGIQACSYNYGATGWLGYTYVWLSGGFIVQATVKLNDYYLSSSKYNNAAYKQFVVCQELGHALGLGHINTVTTDLNVGSCMDYTNDPSGTKGTNGTLVNSGPGPSDFTELNTIYAKLDSTQLSTTKWTTWGYEALEVPEPSAWAMFIMGFGVIGSAMRRRRAPATATC
jgi:hypothetical protein